MKRFRLLLLITVFTLTLTACKPLTFNEEITRIIDLIPETFDADVVLPTGGDTYTITYTYNDEILEDNILVFEQKETDESVSLFVTLSNGEEEKHYTILLTQIGDVDKYALYAIDQILLEAVESITDAIPTTVTSNVTLPDFSTDKITVTYDLDCSDIVRDRIEYTFPTETTSCSMNATVRYQGISKVMHHNFNMAAIDDLPKVPSIYITTNGASEIDSDDNYTPSMLSVTDYTDSSNSLNNESIGIRLRGNSTQEVPKKSYKIKFDSKTALLSDYEEKDWVLLANYMDQTLIRDYVAFELSNNLNMAFTPSYTPVDLYINGVYQGNYLLTDQIEVSNDRVDIEEHVSDTDTGYLIEYDIGLHREGLDETDQNYFVSYGIPFVIKSPQDDDEEYLDSQKEYINDYMDGVIYTLKNKKDYSNLIDEASFIDWYIVNELFKNVDSGYSSVYFYKDKGSLLKMGPVWDFDLSSGAYGHLGAELRGPTGFYTSRSNKNKLLYYLMQYDSFKHSLKERWNEIYDDILVELPNNVLKASDSFTASRYNNFELWDIIGKDEEWYVSPELYELKTYDEQVWFLYDFLETRIAWLDKAINQFD